MTPLNWKYPFIIETMTEKRSKPQFTSGILYAHLCALIILIVSVPAAAKHPNIYIDTNEIKTIKAKIAAGQEPWKSAYSKMISKANTALSQAPLSVTFGGKHTAYGCLKSTHTFCTGAFYYNTDRYDFDVGAQPLGVAVRDLGLGYAFTGDKKYADKAIELIRVWTLDPATYMKPVFTNRQSQIDLFSTLPGLFYGADLVWNYSGWSSAGKKAFQAWAKKLANSAIKLEPDKKNFENWKTAFISAAGVIAEDSTLLDFAFRRYKELIPTQMHGDGKMWREMTRTSGWGGLGYSLYALHAMTLTAEVARHQGVDLYDYTTDDNRGLKLALDWLSPYLINPSTWPYGVGTISMVKNHGQGIYELAYSYWQDPGHLKVIQQWGRPMDMNMWALSIVTLTHANLFDLTMAPTPASISAQPKTQTVDEGEAASKANR